MDDHKTSVAGEAAPAAEPGCYVICLGGSNVYALGGFTQSEAADALDWHQKRAEIESQLAQLAKYKRDAEAWEAVGKQRIAIDYEPRCGGAIQWHAHRGMECVVQDSPLDAVLSLAAQLEQK
jgi:hypothetical protein